MSQEDLEPLPQDLQRLLQQGRPGDEPPPGAREAALSFITASVGALTAPLAASEAASRLKNAVSVPRGAWHALKGSFGIGGLVVGTALGAAGHAALVRHDSSTPVQAMAVGTSPVMTATMSATPPAPSSAPMDVAAPTASTAATVGQEETRRQVAPAPAEKTATHPAEDAAERALIDMARTAVARGDGDGALAPLERHAREFPKGRLAEEREWLRIQALLATGRGDDAKERASSFRKIFPHSLMLPALDELMPTAAPPSPSKK
jgi:hypothetical protein